MRPGEAHLRLVYDGADARVVEDPAALPRAFVAARARCVDDRGALALLRARAIAPADEVLLADCASPPVPEARIPVAPEAHIMVDEPARVVVTASTDAPAWLVLTDTWFPGWRARVDGADVVVQRADHAFRAVALPPGRHEVEFSFTPPRLPAGERARGAWHRAAPPADVTLALVIVRPGADPLDRAEWTHRPALAQVRVAAPSDARPSRPWTTLAGLFVAAIAATALAWGRALSTPRPL